MSSITKTQRYSPRDQGIEDKKIKSWHSGHVALLRVALGRDRKVLRISRLLLLITIKYCDCSYCVMESNNNYVIVVSLFTIDWH